MDGMRISRRFHERRKERQARRDVPPARSMAYGKAGYVLAILGMMVFTTAAGAQQSSQGTGISGYGGQAVQSTMTWEPDTDRPGSDLRSFALDTADPQLCAQACANDPKCRAFTYVKPGIQGSKARCWLKSGVPSPRAKPCCISGVKQAFTDAPAGAAPSGYGVGAAPQAGREADQNILRDLVGPVMQLVQQRLQQQIMEQGQAGPSPDVSGGIPDVSTGSTVTSAAGGSGSVAEATMSGQQSGQGYTENFEGGTPKNWEFVGGACIVQSGQGYVLTFAGAGVAGWYVQPGYDFTLRFRIRQGGGAPEIMLCATGEPPNEKYYIVRLSPDEAEVVKYMNSQQSPMGFVGGKGIGAGTWTTVEMTVSGSGRVISVNVGGQSILTVQDPQPLEPGIVMFRAVGEGGTEIDDLVITSASTSGAVQAIQGGSWETTPMSVPGTPYGGSPALPPSMPASMDGTYPQTGTGQGQPQSSPEVRGGTTDISGRWESSTKGIYMIVQQGDQFTLTAQGKNETASGKIQRDKISVDWSGGTGIGSNEGKITVVDGNGTALRIDWTNGVIFGR